MKILKIKTVDYNNKVIEVGSDQLTNAVMPCVIVGPNGSGKTRILDAIYSVFYHTVDYVRFRLVGVESIEATIEIGGVIFDVIVQYEDSSIERTIDASVFNDLIDNNESRLDYFPHPGNNAAPLNLINGIRKVFMPRVYPDESNGEFNYTNICKKLDTIGSNDIVLIDCPENYGLDSSRQKMLVNRLYQISRNGAQVIIASNSIEIIRRFRGNAIKFLK